MNLDKQYTELKIKMKRDIAFAQDTIASLENKANNPKFSEEEQRFYQRWADSVKTVLEAQKAAFKTLDSYK